MSYIYYTIKYTNFDRRYFRIICLGKDRPPNGFIQARRKIVDNEEKLGLCHCLGYHCVYEEETSGTLIPVMMYEIKATKTKAEPVYRPFTGTMKYHFGKIEKENVWHKELAWRYIKNK